MAMRGHARKFYPDAHQHIYVRALQYFVIFYTMEDRLVYYTIFAVMARKYQVCVLALALMFDHIHHLIKVKDKETMGKFVGVTTSTFAMAFNRDSGRRGPLFWKAFGNASKRKDKEVRSSIAYNYNNSAEKKLFARAEQDRWNFLAYIDSTHPFSKEIDRKSASKKLLGSMDTAFLYNARNEYLDYPVVRRLFQGLEADEQEQLLDFIISLYLPIDKEALLKFFRSYDDMVLAINSNTGSEYDIHEFFDPDSHQGFARMLEVTAHSSFADDPRSVILAPDEQKRQIADRLRKLTSASMGQIKRFLHME